ncbi:MAG: biotin--[acetyl-CoA-carboxylase] ligase [Pseudomonadota bacterium]
MCDAAALQATLGAGLPDCEVTVLPEVGSTNQWLLDRAAHAVGDTFCLAMRQTAGRGRRGKGWVSPAGNFYGSASLTVRGEPAAIGPFSLAAATALAGVLSDLGVSPIGLKWPNDVQVDGCKLAGILLELSPHANPATGSQRVVVGIGLNVEPVEGDTGQRTTSVREAVPAAVLPLDALAYRIWTALRACRDRFEHRGFAGFQDDWAARDVLAGQPVTVLQGETRWHGTARGVNADGTLRVDSGDGERAVSAGEVSVRAR